MISLDTLLSSNMVSSVVGAPINKFVAGASLNAMYGETYDEFGMTLDSLRYYFFLDALVRAGVTRGVTVDGVIVIGDKATAENSPFGARRYLYELGEEREVQTRRVIDTFGLQLRCVLMSSIVSNESFLSKKREYLAQCKTDSQLLSKLEQSVPVAKLVQERASAYSYSLDELTIIADKDIKIGPPREDVYDSLARALNCGQNDKSHGKLSSIYLTPTFPIGKGWSFFFANPQLDEMGVTAYKAGNLDLQNYRARLFSSQTIQDLRGLIEHTFMPRADNKNENCVSGSLPNPLLDLYQVAAFAAWHLGGEEPKFDVTFDREKLADAIIANVYKPLGCAK